MPDATPPADSPPDASSTPHYTGVFRRLLGQLRPWRGTVILSVVMLLAGGIFELFPAFVWKYVADDLATGRPSSPMVSWMASLGGRVHNPYFLLLSAVTWLFIVYVVGETLVTL